MKKPPIVDWMDNYLEKKGAVAEVGPDYYTEFLELTDKKMRRLLQLIICGLDKEIKRMVFDDTARYKDEDIYRLIQNTLSFMVIGRIRLGPDGTLCMFKCKGPEPSPEIQQLLDEKVARCVPLIRRALVELLNCQSTPAKDRKSTTGT